MDYKSAAVEGAVAGALVSLFLGRGRASLSKAAHFGIYGAGAAAVATFALLKTGRKLAGPGGFLTGEDPLIGQGSPTPQALEGVGWSGAEYANHVANRLGRQGAYGQQGQGGGNYGQHGYGGGGGGGGGFGYPHHPHHHGWE